MRVSFMMFMMFLSINIYAETTKGVRLPAIYHVWGEDAKKDRAPITIEEISQCMGQENSVTKEYETFDKEAAILKAESDKFETLSKTLESERAELDIELKKVNDKVSNLNENARKLELRNAEIDALAKQKLNSKQVKEANDKIAKYNQDVKLQNDARKGTNVEADNYHQKQNAFNEKIALAKQDFEIFNQKANDFDQRRTKFNSQLTEYKDKCEGDRKLVK